MKLKIIVMVIDTSYAVRRLLSHKQNLRQSLIQYTGVLHSALCDEMGQAVTYFNIKVSPW